MSDQTVIEPARAELTELANHSLTCPRCRADQQGACPEGGALLRRWSTANRVAKRRGRR